MKIGHVIQSGSLAEGGPTASTFAMCNALGWAGCECAIVCQKKDTEVQTGLDDQITIRLAHIGRNPFNRREGIRTLREFINEVNIVHLHGLWDPLPCAAANIARRVGKPYIVSLHGMLLERSIAHHRLRKQLFLAVAGNSVLRNATALHFTTQTEMEQADPLLPAEPERAVIPLTIDRSLFVDDKSANRWRESFPLLPETWPRLLFLSRIHPVKNLPSLLGALPQLVREFPGLHLVVAGGGEASYVRRMHELAGMLLKEKRVIFVGPVSGAAKACLIRSSTIMTIPSFHENFGMAIAEGLACGVPALVTPGLGIGEEILAEGAGFSCGEDENSVSASLLGALGNRERLELAGMNGRRWAQRELEASVVAKKFLAVYESALASGGGKPM